MSVNKQTSTTLCGYAREVGCLTTGRASEGSSIILLTNNCEDVDVYNLDTDQNLGLIQRHFALKFLGRSNRLKMFQIFNERYNYLERLVAFENQ